jgi:hypothetical protein
MRAGKVVSRAIAVARGIEGLAAMTNQIPNTTHVSGELLESAAMGEALDTVSATHLKTCGQCRVALEAMIQENELFNSELAPAGSASRVAAAPVLQRADALAQRRRSLRPLMMYAAAALVMLASALALVWKNSPETDTPPVTKVDGRGIFVRPLGSQEWIELQQDSTLPKQFTVQATGKDDAELRLSCGARLSLSPGAVAEVFEDDNGARVRLESGRIVAQGSGTAGLPVTVEVPEKELAQQTIFGSIAAEVRTTDNELAAKGETAMRNGFTIRLMPAFVVLAASVSGGEPVKVGDEKDPKPPMVAEEPLYKGKTAQNWIQLLGDAEDLEEVKKALAALRDEAKPGLLKILSDNAPHGELLYERRHLLRACDALMYVGLSADMIPEFTKLLNNTNYDIRAKGIELLGVTHIDHDGDKIEVGNKIVEILNAYTSDRDRAIANAAQVLIKSIKSTEKDAEIDKLKRLIEESRIVEAEAQLAKIDKIESGTVPYRLNEYREYLKRYKEQQKNSAARINELLEIARNHFNNADYESALAGAAHVIANDPQNAAAKDLQRAAVLKLQTANDAHRTKVIEKFLKSATDSLDRNDLDVAELYIDNLALISPKDARLEQLRKKLHEKRAEQKEKAGKDSSKTVRPPLPIPPEMIPLRKRGVGEMNVDD